MANNGGGKPRKLAVGDTTMRSSTTTSSRRWTTRSTRSTRDTSPDGAGRDSASRRLRRRNRGWRPGGAASTLPPQYGDSHFYSATPAECAQVAQRFPGFVYEVDRGVPDRRRPISRAANARRIRCRSIDCGTTGSTPTIVTRPTVLIRDQMVAKGYIVEGYGADRSSCAHRRSGRRCPLICCDPALAAGSFFRRVV